MRARLALLIAGVMAWPCVRADIDVEITGVDGDIRRNVLALLSLERYNTRDKLREETIERLHARVEREVQSAMRPFGYYEPRVTSRVTDEGNGRDWRVDIAIEPGQPVIVDEVSVRVTGPRANDPVFTEILANIPLRRGDRLSHAAYERVKSTLQRSAAGNGYLDAKLVRNELRVDPPNHTASAFIELQTGERYRFGPTVVEQSVVREDLARKFLRFREGDPYDATELLRTQFALDDSQYFSTVEVLPQERDRENLIVPVRISAQPNRRNRYTFGIGYATDTETRGTLSWENRRVNDRGHRFRVETEVAALSSGFTARYIWPIGDPALEKFELEGNATNQELGDLDTETVEGRASITNVLGTWQRVLYTRATYTTTQTSQEKTGDSLLIPGISYASVPKGYLGEELYGRTLYTELSGSTQALGASSNFLQLRVSSERVFDLVPRWHLLLRGELGATATNDFDGVPGTERFFAGGDRSVRGFGINDLSPTQTVVNEDGTTSEERVGGRYLAVGTIEIIRDLPRNLGAALFFDVGNAFDEWDVPLEYSVGVGIRFRLPVATLGVDIAQALSENESPRLHINFSPKL